MFQQIIVLLFVNILLYNVESAKILVVFPFAGRSQFIAGENYFKKLAARGHDVTVVSAHPQEKVIKNYRDIPVFAIRDGYSEIIAKFINPPTGFYDYNLFASNVYIDFQRKVLDDPQVQNLMEFEHFDVVIIEAFQTELLAGLGAHFNAHLIGISTMGTQPATDELVGNTSPVSYLSHPLTDLGPIDSIWKRWKNLIESIRLKWFHNFVHIEKERKLFGTYFPSLRNNFDEVRKNFSLVLLNTHLSVGVPRPYVPNMIEVGGFFIRQKMNPLPKSITNFIDEAKDGVIYFSMGSNINSSNFPRELREKIMQTFAALPERVLWKFEDKDLPGKPDNIYISSWFSQSEILAHPKVKLFITHCGYLSINEAVHFAKPILGLPMFFDQFSNAKYMDELGFGIVADLNRIDKSEFISLIREAIDNPIYRKNIEKASQIYHDRPMNPLDTAIYWTEYIIRHNGAPHLRVAGKDLHIIQYFNIDILLIIFTIALFLYIQIRKFFKKRFTKKKRSGKKWQ